MPSKNTIHADLKRLRTLCKSIRTIEYWRINSGELMQGSPLAENLTRLIHKRDKILEKYSVGINALSPEESLIFTLYYRQGLTQKQVATKTNYCKSSITKHLSVIIGKLK